ncbi:hypothetical protein DFH28DRAFT_961705 [Melampsora americana]|nr:hypothetical protein DFH28DRAFT_961705 [Melampsora americana]
MFKKWFCVLIPLSMVLVFMNARLTSAWLSEYNRVTDLFWNVVMYGSGDDDVNAIIDSRATIHHNNVRVTPTDFKRAANLGLYTTRNAWNLEKTEAELRDYLSCTWKYGRYNVTIQFRKNTRRIHQVTLFQS